MTYAVATESRPDDSSTDLLIAEAGRRDIDVVSFPEIDDRMVALENEGHREHIYYASSDLQGHVMYKLLQNKMLTTAWLRRGGFPVPADLITDDLAEAEAFLATHGKIVVKPIANTGGTGVTPAITTVSQLPAAFTWAQEETMVDEASGRVVCQEHVEGKDFRLLVIDQEHVFAIERIPAYVEGDGVQTVRHLVEEYNGSVKPEVQIVLDAAADQLMAKQGLTYDGVPAAGQRVTLSLVANYHSGGRLKDVTAEMSLAVREFAVRVAQYFNLPVVGIDMLAESVTGEPGVLIELNATPDLTIHHYPHTGESRDVASVVIDMLFPETKEEA